MNSEPVIKDEIEVDDSLDVGVALNSTGPGARLAAAREAAKLTVGDVASHLNLTVTVIEALEHDDTSRLPSPVFVRGYIKNYAQMVGLPKAELLQMYDDNRPVEETFEMRAPADMPSVGRRGPSARMLGSVIALVVVVIAVSWWFGSREYVGGESMFGSLFGGDEPVVVAPVEPAPQPAAPEPEPIVVVAPEPGAAVEAVVIGDAAEVAPGAEAVADVTADATADAAADAEAAAGDAPPPVPATEPAAPEPVAAPQPATPPGEAVVRLRLSDDSWVEVVDRDGQRLVFDLVRGGDDREVRGRTPMRVLLGRAGGVRIDVNGAPLDLDEYRAKGIARFLIDVEDGRAVTRLP